MKVVIVESPSKAKTINRYLGKDYDVYASFGHVRDLPPKDGSVDPDNDFAMLWEVDGKAAKRLSDIAAAEGLTPKDLIDANAVYGFGLGATMIQVLKQCGNDLTRENIMKQAANVKDLELPMLLPGMKINTSPTNFSPIRQMQLAQFNGESWILFGELLQG